MKILPCMSKGIVLMHEDGTFELAPFQVFLSAGGQTVIRIGRTALYFDKDGRFDGEECHGRSAPELAQSNELLVDALEASKRNQGLAPEEPYFQPGSPAFERETAAWAHAKPTGDKSQTYVAAVRAPDKDKLQ